MSNHGIENSAAAVQEAIADSGRTKRSISDETGIPYPTLNRKLAGKAEFKFSELLVLAEALGVPPWQFTPSIFVKPAAVAA